MKVPPPQDLNPAIKAVLQRFREYSLDIKHLRTGTVDSETSHVRRFLENMLDRNPQGLYNGLAAEDIRDYVLEELDKLSNSTKGRYITSIRNFFHFQEFYGQSVTPSIFHLPLSPAVWKKSAFPSTIDTNVFDTLYLIPDKNTDIGKRNSCVILFFTELGLRCSEVAALTLDDFNWHSGCVTVCSTKNGSNRVLPLSAKLGSSLVEYLMNARPQSSCRTLFVRFSHLRGDPMGCVQIRGVVRRNSAKAGLEASSCGTHVCANLKVDHYIN
jgi:site-specific recombinase XerD